MRMKGVPKAVQWARIGAVGYQRTGQHRPVVRIARPDPSQRRMLQGLVFRAIHGLHRRAQRVQLGQRGLESRRRATLGQHACKMLTHIVESHLRREKSYLQRESLQQPKHLSPQHGTHQHVRVKDDGAACHVGLLRRAAAALRNALKSLTAASTSSSLNNITASS